LTWFGWKLTGRDPILGNETRFVPYWWDEGGFHIAPKYTTIERFVKECCTTTLGAVALNKNKNAAALIKKGFFCVSAN
jgi:hypothetical protein